jgi:hypothetical protein
LSYIGLSIEQVLQVKAQKTADALEQRWFLHGLFG